MNKAIKWFKGTVTGKNLYSKGNEGYKDFEVALRIAKKEVFDDIRNKFNSKHQCSSCDYGIMEFELKRLEKKHLGEKH